MITSSRPLPLGQILLCKKNDEIMKTLWCGAHQEEILTHRSWVSLYMIVVYLKNSRSKERPVVYVPALFCAETIRGIEKEAEIVYYEVTEDLLPDLKLCMKKAKEKKPDIFLFVHYFGKNFDASNAKVFCKNNDALLVEDAAHVLYPTGKIGTYGHFTIYSPWKSYGLMDGAILTINKNSDFKEEVSDVKAQLYGIQEAFPEYSKVCTFKWKCKKTIQKIVPRFIGVRRYRCNKEVTEIFDEVIEKFRISEFSKVHLQSIQNDEICQLAERKLENYYFLLEYLKEKYDIEALWPEMKHVPYALMIKVKDDRVKEEIISDLEQVGVIASEWPDISKNVDIDSNANIMKRNTLMISIHDGMDFNLFKKKLRIKDNDSKSIDLRLKEISQEAYNELCVQNLLILPVLQSLGYAEAKKDVQNWKVKYWKVVEKSNPGNTIAFFLTLSKYGCIYRINHGPIFIKQFDKEVYALIKKKFSGFLRVLFVAPNSERNGKNFLMFARLGYKKQKSYFTTGFVCLQTEEENIRKQMDSKWRNCLKSAEKQDITVEYVIDSNELEKMVELHSLDKTHRNYKDSGDDITRHLFLNGNMFAMCAKNRDREIIAFIMVALHNSTGTYYIGWSNEEGYRSNASRLLLWKSALKLKEMGMKWFDLGGIDFVNTRSIAEFKVGIGCNVFEYVGEYICW